MESQSAGRRDGALEQAVLAIGRYVLSDASWGATHAERRHELIAALEALERGALESAPLPPGSQDSDAPGASFPGPDASGGDSTDPAPPNPTHYLSHADEADRPAKRRQVLERAQPASPSAPSGGP
jgi:hypothetical protein